MLSGNRKRKFGHVANLIRGLVSGSVSSDAGLLSCLTENLQSGMGLNGNDMTDIFIEKSSAEQKGRHVCTTVPGI